MKLAGYFAKFQWIFKNTLCLIFVCGIWCNAFSDILCTVQYLSMQWLNPWAPWHCWRHLWNSGLYNSITRLTQWPSRPHAIFEAPLTDELKTGIQQMSALHSCSHLNKFYCCFNHGLSSTGFFIHASCTSYRLVPLFSLCAEVYIARYNQCACWATIRKQHVYAIHTVRVLNHT